jgi:uncharacterized membrane protein
MARPKVIAKLFGPVELAQIVAAVLLAYFGHKYLAVVVMIPNFD